MVLTAELLGLLSDLSFTSTTYTQRQANQLDMALMRLAQQAPALDPATRDCCTQRLEALLRTWASQVGSPSWPLFFQPVPPALPRQLEAWATSGNLVQDAMHLTRATSDATPEHLKALDAALLPQEAHRVPISFVGALGALEQAGAAVDWAGLADALRCNTAVASSSEARAGWTTWWPALADQLQARALGQALGPADLGRRWRL